MAVSPVAGAPIRLERLTKRYGGRAVVDDLSADIAPGRVTGFLGRNGAGKTTTLRLILGLAAADAGSATFGGRRYGQLRNPQTVIGTALGPEAHPGRSGRNHLRVLAAVARLPQARVDAVLAQVGLSAAEARRRVGGYSLGMRQRLAMAGALLGEPDYLVLDEPSNGLDPDGMRWLRALLREQADSGRTVLMSSHLLGEVGHSVDDLLVIHRGRRLYGGPLAGFGGQVGAVSARVHPDDHEQAVTFLTERGIEFTQSGGRLRFIGAAPSEAGAWLFQADVEVHELSRAETDLEQAFFDLLERAEVGAA